MMEPDKIEFKKNKINLEIKTPQPIFSQQYAYTSAVFNYTVNHKDMYKFDIYLGLGQLFKNSSVRTPV